MCLYLFQDVYFKESAENSCVCVCVILFFIQLEEFLKWWLEPRTTS